MKRWTHEQARAYHAMMPSQKVAWDRQAVRELSRPAMIDIFYHTKAALLGAIDTYLYPLSYGEFDELVDEFKSKVEAMEIQGDEC